MFYTVYQITNKIDGKTYIGKHKTSNINDGYMGSGLYVKRAITLHGVENFEKKILFIFDNEKQMNDKEAEIVTDDFCIREDTYNICAGGHGGWSYINRSGLRTVGHDKEMYSKISDKLKGRNHQSEKQKAAIKKSHKDGKYRYDTFTGKKHTEQTKLKIGKSNSKMTGHLNSQFGSVWVTNGKENKKISKEEKIPDGWILGVTYTPLFKEISLCESCKKYIQSNEDFHWLTEYKKSGMSVSKFVDEVYPYNRASFYNMKKRLEPFSAVLDT